MSVVFQITTIFGWEPQTRKMKAYGSGSPMKNGITPTGTGVNLMEVLVKTFYVLLQISSGMIVILIAVAAQS